MHSITPLAKQSLSTHIWLEHTTIATSRTFITTIKLGLTCKVSNTFHFIIIKISSWLVTYIACREASSMNAVIFPDYAFMHPLHNSSPYSLIYGHRLITFESITSSLAFSIPKHLVYLQSIFCIWFHHTSSWLPICNIL